MKILIFIPSLSCGGAERITVNLANFWTKKYNYNIVFVTLSSFENDFYKIDNKIKRIIINNIYFNKNKLNSLLMNLKIIIKLRYILKQESCDVALSIMLSCNVLLAISSIGIKTFTIGSERIHPPQLYSGVVWMFLRKYFYRHHSAITSLTEQTAIWLKNNTSAKKVVAINNCIQLPMENLLPKIDIPDYYKRKRKLLLSVGRIEFQKGFDLLIDAFKIIEFKFIEWDLVIIGDGSLRNKLMNDIILKKLENRIYMPGKAGNISEWYEHADLFVLSSRFEGFGNVLVEALAHGLPVVSFDCDSGPRDIIRNGIDGFLVEPNNVTKLSESLSILMNDSSLRDNFSYNAYQARSRFSINKISDQWISLFGEINQNYDK